MGDPNSGINNSAIILAGGTDIDHGERGREYRKGNWTLHETMVLITGKRLDDERRLKGGDKRGKSAEFRWKWVENYCWKNGCQRSQNQCNDKWDNLLRDFKKVRDYENRIQLQPGQRSYWNLEKPERKERGLPSNMLLQVYESLHEIVDKRLPARTSSVLQQQMLMLDPAAPGRLPGTAANAPTSADMSKSMESDDEDSGEPRSEMRKRKSVTGGEGLAPAVCKSASELSHTLLACEEKKDKRHRELLGIQERQLILEETKFEINRQGMEGLIGAVNNLANAVLTLASENPSLPQP